MSKFRARAILVARGNLSGVDKANWAEYRRSMLTQTQASLISACSPGRWRPMLDFYTGLSGADDHPMRET